MLKLVLFLGLSLTLALNPSLVIASGPKVMSFDKKLPIPEGREEEFVAVGQLLASDRRCTATLVAPQTLLTARHCYDPSLSYAWMDGRDRMHTVVTGYVLEGSDMTSDIAVLYLASPVFDLKPIPLATKDHSPITQLVAVGYGATTFIYRHGEFTWLGAGEKRAEYGLGYEYDPVSGRSAHFHVLPGDSGGPLIDKLTWTVVGVTSAFVYDTDNGTFTYYGSVFAPVVAHIGEILVQ